MIYLASANLKLWEFLVSGGIFMLLIMLCCFVTIAVSIHRALSLRPSAIVPAFLNGELARCEQYFVQEKSSALYQALKKTDTPIGHIGRVALSGEFSSRAEASEAVEATAKNEVVKLEGGMGILEAIITIAPLLGLLGTVSGLVTIFGGLGASEVGSTSDPTLIAAGIATALNTTVAGIVVAVIAVIFHSYFSRRLESISAQLELLTNHLLQQFYKHGGPKLYAREISAEKAKIQSAPLDSSGGGLQNRISKQL